MTSPNQSDRIVRCEVAIEFLRRNLERHEDEQKDTIEDLRGDINALRESFNEAHKDQSKTLGILICVGAIVTAFLGAWFRKIL